MSNRIPWARIGATVAGAAVGAATALVVAAQLRPRVLHTPTRVPPEPLPPGARFPHEDFSPVLRAIVDEDGLVDYAALRRDPMGLYRFVAWIEAYSPQNTPAFFPADADRLAYWLNAYNALALLAVCDAYPVASILQVRPVGRVFYALRFPVGGTLMTLEEIEHGVIRPVFHDARTHFALSPAARGGPRLRREAYLPERLEEQLGDQMRRFLTDDEKVRVDVMNRALLVSPIFTWFADDFTTWLRDTAPDQPNDLITMMLPYLSDVGRTVVIDDNYPLRYRAYDWRLNASPRATETMQEAA
ncbi:MAG TPA: DUF547 domain-containing protein [Armatimonadota bacterium]|nr:DUF547 domain-containing protein [Armatimonadota bacterium]